MICKGGCRWLALGILFVGVVLVQSPKVAEEAAGAQSAVLGMAAVASACLLASSGERSVLPCSASASSS